MMETQRSDTEKIIWLKWFDLVTLLDKMHKSKIIISYCLKCRKNTENINPKISETSNGKTMILSNCAISGSKKIKIY